MLDVMATLLYTVPGSTHQKRCRKWHPNDHEAGVTSLQLWGLFVYKTADQCPCDGTITYYARYEKKYEEAFFPFSPY